MLKIANARLSEKIRTVLSKHVGCVVVVDMGFNRAAFRIHSTGCFVAVSSLVDADVYITLADDGVQARGNATLLRDLGVAWQELRGSLDDWLSVLFGRSAGLQAAEYARLAAARLKEHWHDSYVPPANDVARYYRQSRDLERKINELTARLARLSNDYGAKNTSH